MQHEKWKNVIILGALRPPSPLGSMLDPVIMIEFMHLSALKFSTLTRGGGGWRPFLHLHVKWSFDDVLIFRCVPLSKNDQNFFEILNYFPQKRTLWRGQSLSSPINWLLLHFNHFIWDVLNVPLAHGRAKPHFRNRVNMSLISNLILYHHSTP